VKTLEYRCCSCSVYEGLPFDGSTGLAGRHVGMQSCVMRAGIGRCLYARKSPNEDEATRESDEKVPHNLGEIIECSPAQRRRGGKCIGCRSQ